MRAIVCGGRDYANEKHIHETLSNLGVTFVIEGGASGADKAAAKWAYYNEVPNRCFPADWKAHGRAAGPIRNKQMLEVGKPDVVIAFPGGKGTENMVKQAEKAGVKVIRPRTPHKEEHEG